MRAVVIAFNRVDPVVLDRGPAAVYVVTALVLNGHEAVFRDVDCEELLALLRFACLEHKDAGGDTDTEEQILGELHDLEQTMVAQYPRHLGVARLLQLLVGQDEATERAALDTVEHVLDDLHATELVLVRRVHQDLRRTSRFHPVAGALGAGVHVGEVRLAIFVDEHVRAGEGVDLAVELDAVELLGLDLLGLGRVHAACLADHVAHRLDEERAGARAGVEYSVVLIDAEQAVHETGDVVGREDLAGLALLLVAVELVEEDRHHVFAVPGAGVDESGDLGDPVDEVADQVRQAVDRSGVVVVGGDVHLDLGVHVREQLELAVLLEVVLDRLVECVQDSVVELAVVHASHEDRVVAARDEGACGEDHAVVEVLDPEVRMQ